jgi:hypothetical protein
MSNIETYTSNLLTIEVEESQSEINIKFKGKSTERDPSGFISPVLLESMRNSKKFKKIIRMDFQDLEYMNSSTITPIIKILESANDTGNSISILYRKSKKWQELCFSALRIFETKDHRIEITGK